ncbi:MAG: hypothetical protein IJ899_14675 [Blautia sp.]|nr:hypothetical protein [Blautia sp.]
MLGLIFGLMLGACCMGVQASLWQEDSEAKAKTISKLRKHIVILAEDKKELARNIEREKAVNEILKNELKKYEKAERERQDLPA